MNLRDMLLRSVEGIEDRERLLAEADGPACIRVVKTKTVVITLDRAAHQVRLRIEAKKHRSVSAHGALHTVSLWASEPLVTNPRPGPRGRLPSHGV
jgi:hypothetical protein